MMRDLYNALPLPDDRPITSVCVVEELSGCPPNFTAVSKTHDQDIDADLYKDGFFRRVTRYLCHSKVDGYMGYVVEQLAIVNDRDSRPTGYTIVEQTFDTSQKAFKKKQLCFKQVPQSMASQTITDIIILSRSKMAPEGFSLVGEMNGLCICVKCGPAPASSSYNKPGGQPASSSLPYGMDPRGGGSTGGGGGGGGGGRIYPGLMPARPAPELPPPIGSSGPGRPQGLPPPLPPRVLRHPAPHSPSPTHHATAHTDTSTLYGPGQSALFGVPFVLNKKYVKSGDSSSAHIPTFSKKSRQQIEDEFYYSFTLEQDIVQRPTAT
ncbi:multivesicular body subunit 12B-like [Eriocheir sinensis]|uniref:multivesicular body subunit 12B-like n=1 Tax=Eriocheir sinensis TaxID=95602 RepID=UPI0021CAC9E9|nr:multivesicular body subunit 12B-like [Eriocheir sinensis]XP_050701180.1 multivesicular body subunit 12B-like [Eriocheir sinensis]